MADVIFRLTRDLRDTRGNLRAGVGQKCTKCRVASTPGFMHVVVPSVINGNFERFPSLVPASWLKAEGA